jgi:transposase
VIVVGVDPHKKSHTAVAAAENGRPLGDVTVVARHKGHERMLEWARSLDDDRVFAIEDCRHVSGALERFLIEWGERVVRVPPKMMAGARRSVREAGKSDPIDALAVAHAALRTPDHRPSRRGNRQLNAAFHRIAVTQIRCHKPARDYVERKMSDGKTKREALRCLKRQLVRAVFTTMRSDAMDPTEIRPVLQPAAA